MMDLLKCLVVRGEPCMRRGFPPSLYTRLMLLISRFVHASCSYTKI